MHGAKLSAGLIALFGMATSVALAAPAHPRIWITADDLPRLQAIADDTTENALGCVPAEAWAKILARADQLVAAPAYHYKVNMPGREGAPPQMWEYTLSDERPPRHDDYSHYPPWTAMFQERSDSISTRLKYFLLAWVITGDDVYYEKAREIVMHLCAWDDMWHDLSTSGGQRSSLDTSHGTIWVSMFYDWCYDELSEADRTVVRQALLEKGLEWLAIGAAKGTVYHNITVLQVCALGIGSIAIMDEEERAGEWIDLALSRIAENFAEQGADGGAMEGPMYGNYAASAIADLLWATQTAEIEHNLLEHNYLRTLPRYCVSLLDPGTNMQPCFGDGGPGQAFGHTNLTLALGGDPDAAWYCQRIGMFDEPTPRTLIAMDPERIQPVDPDYNPSQAFVDVGYGILRDGFDPTSAFMAFKAGPPAKGIGHNHYDHNSFVISYAGAWIASDPGYRDYFHPARRKYTVSSLGHSTVVLDMDEEYLASHNYRSAGHEQVKLTDSRIAEFFAGESYDYLLGDGAGSYNTDELTVLDRFDRQVIFAKPNVFFVRDTLAAPEPHRFTALTHTGGHNAFQIDGQQAQAIASTCLLQVHPFSPDGITLTTARYLEAESRGPYLAATTEPVKQTTIVTALIPRHHMEPITNGGFENGMVGWTPRSAQNQMPNHVVDTEVAHSGAASGRIDNNGYYYTRPFHLAPGTEFTARWWGKCTGEGAHGYVYHSAGGKSVKRVELAGPTTDEWTQFEYTGIIPEGTEQTRLALQMFGEGQCWYDDVEVIAAVDQDAAEPATVTALDEGASGAVVEVDGITHVLLCGEAGQARTIEAAGHTFVTDAEIAVVTVGDGAARAFMLRGETITVDGQARGHVAGNA